MADVMLRSVMPEMVFPSTGMQVLSAIIHLLGVSIIAYCLSRRIAIEDIRDVWDLAQLSLARHCIILLFIDSWLFLFIGGVIVFGAGMELSQAVCSVGIYLCIACYGSSKLLIYLFLMEKVYIVWSPLPGSKRFKCPVYVLCFVVMTGYLAIVALLVVGHIAHIRDDGVCMIGLRPIASLPLLSYDLFINILLTGAFLWPLLRKRFTNPRIKRMASRTLWAASVALTTSCVNICILTLMHGQQRGWVCLGSCGTDVVINALVLFWVTSGLSQSRGQSHISLQLPSHGQPSAQGDGSRPNNFALKRPSLPAMPGRTPLMMSLPSPLEPASLSSREKDSSNFRGAADYFSPRPPTTITLGVSEHGAVSEPDSGSGQDRSRSDAQETTSRSDGGESGRPHTNPHGSPLTRFVSLFRPPSTEADEYAMQVTVVTEREVERDAVWHRVPTRGTEKPAPAL